MIASYTRKITHVVSLWFVHVSLNSVFTNQEDMTLIWSFSPFWIHCCILFKNLYEAGLLSIDVLPTIQYPNKIFNYKYPVTSLGVEMSGLHIMKWRLCVCVCGTMKVSYSIQNFDYCIVYLQKLFIPPFFYHSYEFVMELCLSIQPIWSYNTT